jgi:hypothetical protein
MMAQAKSEGREGADIMEDERMHDDLHGASSTGQVRWSAPHSSLEI